MPNFGQKISSREPTPTWPLAPVVRRHLSFLPLIACLGFLATALEGIGIGLLVPLLAFLLGSAVPAGLPAPIRAAADLLLAYDTQSRVIILGLAVIGLIALKGAVQAANGWVVAVVEGRIGKDIRDALANRLLALEYPFFLENDRARLSRILSTDSAEVLMATRSALALVPALVGLAVIALFLAWLNFRLFLIAAAGALVVQSVLVAVERRQRHLSYEVTASDLALWDRMVSIVDAMRVIRLFGQQSSEERRFAADSDRMRRAVQASRMLLSSAIPTIEAMVALLFVVILIAGYRMGMTVPAITAFLVLLSRAQPHASTISHSRLNISSFRGALAEVEWLLAQKPAITTMAAPASIRIDKPIVFDGVCYAYPDGNPALLEADFSIPPGSATALIGPSGSGKTTIVNLICRLIDPGSGRILLGEQAIEPIDPAAWRARIAVAGQDIDLVDARIAENIAFGRPSATLEEIEDVARAAGAAEFIAALPDGYNTRVTSQGLNFSGGQRQRIGLARALLRNPDLLILDEAMSAVDAPSEVEITRLLMQRRYFQTALFISHRKSTLAACDYGIVVDGGRIAEYGPLSGLSYFRRMAGEFEAVA